MVLFWKATDESQDTMTSSKCHTVSPYKYVLYINEEYTTFYRGNKTTSAKCPRL